MTTRRDFLKTGVAGAAAAAAAAAAVTAVITGGCTPNGQPAKEETEQKTKAKEETPKPRKTEAQKLGESLVNEYLGNLYTGLLFSQAEEERRLLYTPREEFQTGRNYRSLEKWVEKREGNLAIITCPALAEDFKTWFDEQENPTKEDQIAQLLKLIRDPKYVVAPDPEAEDNQSKKYDAAFTLADEKIKEEIERRREAGIPVKKGERGQVVALLMAAVESQLPEEQAVAIRQALLTRQPREGR